MRQDYRNKLRDMRIRLEKAELFAERSPVFAEQILESLLTGEETWQRFYKKDSALLAGVTRGHFTSGTNLCVTNCNKKYDVDLFKIYVNSLTEYSSMKEYGLCDIPETVPVFFYDKINSTFYCTDEQIGLLLEALNAWKISAFYQAKKDRSGADIQKLEEKIAELQATLKELL